MNGLDALPFADYADHNPNRLPLDDAAECPCWRDCERDCTCGCHGHVITYLHDDKYPRLVGCICSCGARPFAGFTSARLLVDREAAAHLASES